jgi:metal-responsive CopG/Arc/MetJ family transcriptional regulator
VQRATAEEIGVLDSLVVELGAESRSRLIAAAIEAYLLTKSCR